MVHFRKAKEENSSETMGSYSEWAAEAWDINSNSAFLRRRIFSLVLLASARSRHFLYPRMEGRTRTADVQEKEREREREKRQPVIGGEISNRFGQLFLLFSPFVVIINKSFSTNHSLTKTFYGLSPIYASSSRWKRCKLSSASVGSVSKGERTGCWRKGSNTNNDLFQKEENTVILFFASDLKAKTS